MSLIKIFSDAEQYVKRYYPDDINNAYKFLTISLSEIGKTFFFAQYIHVVYCSGFSWDIVDKYYDKIIKTYCDYQYNVVDENREKVQKEAMKIIKHEGKIKAILDTAHWLNIISDEEFNRFLREGESNIDTFTKLPYIAKKTKYHLGICMGFNVIKPDVHIQRIADHYDLDPFEMCETLSEQTGYPRRVVDAILWRASEQGAINLE